MDREKEFHLLLTHCHNQYPNRRSHTASLYTNIPQEEGIDIVCTACDNFHKNNPPIPTKYLREMLGLILKENSFQFNGRHLLQTHGTAMGTKTAVSFANIFMAKIETNSKETRLKTYSLETLY